jgi:hypothetical protein
MTGANGGPLKIADGTPALIDIARKVALAFYLASRGTEAGLMEDAVGLDGEARQPLTAVNATSTIAGSVGRKVLTGFGGTAPTLSWPARAWRLQSAMLLRVMMSTHGRHYFSTIANFAVAAALRESERLKISPLFRHWSSDEP